MTKEELTAILEKHVKRLNGENGGAWANLSLADLSGADLSGADLSRADLSGADLTGANILRADLSRADLTGANISGANLSGANLTGANLDYSCFPLWCGGSNFKTDMKLIRQILAHLSTLKCEDEAWPALRAAILPEALKSHRADDLRVKGGGM
jgi:hypothetical protein